MFRRERLIVWLVLVLYACSAIISLRDAEAGTTPRAAIFVDNSSYVTAYPIDGKGDVAPIALTTDMISPGAVARDAVGRIYVTNTPTNTVTVYPANAMGNVPPLAVIGGSETRLANPTGIALDASGKIYVLNTGTSAVTVYPPLGSSTGILNEAPAATISGSETMLAGPTAIAVDASGDLYVANSFGGPAVAGSSYAPGVITIYLAGSNGNEAPSDVIAGAATGLIYPAGIALDSSGDIYVVNDGTTIYESKTITYPPSITVYPSGSGGNLSPIVTITGDTTALGYPTAIALDSDRNIYATNLSNSATAISIYSAASNGNVPPSATISGVETGLSNGNGIALDSQGDIYISNQTGGPIDKGSVTVYARGASDDAAPINTLTSRLTGISESQGIAIDSVGKIYLTNGAANSVEIFARGSYATDSPMSIIAGSETGLSFPTQIALDANNNIYVLNFNATIAIYPPNSSGDVSPKKVISIDTKGNLVPAAIALGPDGTLYVANDGFEKCNASGQKCYQTSLGNIGIFPPGIKDNASTVIAGAATELASPSAITVSSSGKIFVANQGLESSNNPPYFIPSPNTYPPSVTVFAPGSEADAKPIANISGPHTGLGNPVGIAVDAYENIYVLNGSNLCGERAISFPGVFVLCQEDFGLGGAWYLPPGHLDFGPPPPGDLSLGPSILVFKAGSTGDAKPIAIIDGPFTAINGTSIAIGRGR